MKAGEIEYTAFDTPSPLRWGDYTEMTIDPDGTTFWYLGEYSKSGVTDPQTNWGTYIGAFEFGATEQLPTNVPALSTWGVIVAVLLIGFAGVIYYSRRSQNSFI